MWVIDQEWDQDRWILYDWLSPLRVIWAETAPRSNNKLKKRTRPISSHLDQANLVNKEFIIGWDKQHCIFCGTRRVTPTSRQDSFSTYSRLKNENWKNCVFDFRLGAQRQITHRLVCSDSQSQPSIWFILPSREVSNTFRFNFCAFSGLDLAKWSNSEITRPDILAKLFFACL